MSNASNDSARRGLAALILVASAGALVVGGLGAVQLRHALAKGPMLVSPHGITVGPDGRIYTGVDDMHVHVYERDGTLVNAWTIPDASGPLRLAFSHAGELWITSRGAGDLYVFSGDGSRIETRPEPAAWQRMGGDHDRSFRTTDGEVFALDGMSILQTEPGPPREVVPQTRWPLRAVARQPLWLGVLLFLGGLGPIVALVMRAPRA